jgi:hypothetical protein
VPLAFDALSATLLGELNKGASGSLKGLSYFMQEESIAVALFRLDKEDFVGLTLKIMESQDVARTSLSALPILSFCLNITVFESFRKFGLLHN